MSEYKLQNAYRSAMAKKMTRKERRESAELVEEFAIAEFEKHDWVLVATLAESQIELPTRPDITDLDACEKYVKQMLRGPVALIESQCEQMHAAYELAKERGANFAASYWRRNWHSDRTLRGLLLSEARRAHSRSMMIQDWPAEKKEEVRAAMRKIREG